MSFDRIPSFIQLEIVSYLNVRDAGRFMSTSCKNYLLMTEVARCNPYIVAEASRAEDNCSAKGVISRAVTKIPSKPNIVFAFYEHSIYDMKQSLERLLPSDTSVIAAEAMNVQANVDGVVTNTGGTYDDDDEGTGVSILLGSFPESISGSCIVTGASIKNARCSTDVYASVKQVLQISGLIGGQEWSTFILYACGLRGHSLASYVIEILQVSHAEAAIIGGVCDSALVRTHPVSLTSSSTISRIKSGVVVLALGGNTPLRACVSRGMEPLHAPHVQISDSFPIYNQYNNNMTNREDETSQSPIGYVVSKIRRTDSALEEETVISDWMGMSGAGDYLGIKRPDDMGYTLHLISSDLFIDDERILVKECKPLNGAEVKLFRLTSAACVQGMVSYVRSLKYFSFISSSVATVKCVTHYFVRWHYILRILVSMI
mmetsp:Transcript_22448/g.32743  ORF Transcript_22448/g.32743 Transcript_22448/m.32743 type:complete len:430 (+) Transcript_22448:127-1416(+)